MHRAISFCTLKQENVLQRLCSLPFYHGPLAQFHEIWTKFSLQTADIFLVVFFGGREAATGNTSAVRRLDEIILSLITTLEKNFLELGPILVSRMLVWVATCWG